MLKAQTATTKGNPARTNRTSRKVELKRFRGGLEKLVDQTGGGKANWAAVTKRHNKRQNGTTKDDTRRGGPGGMIQRWNKVLGDEVLTDVECQLKWA